MHKSLSKVGQRVWGRETYPLANQINAPEQGLHLPSGVAALGSTPLRETRGLFSSQLTHLAKSRKFSLTQRLGCSQPQQ